MLSRKGGFTSFIASDITSDYWLQADFDHQPMPAAYHFFSV